jgi:hypothetical protein
MQMAKDYEVKYAQISQCQCSHKKIEEADWKGAPSKLGFS